MPRAKSRHAFRQRMVYLRLNLTEMIQPISKYKSGDRLAAAFEFMTSTRPVSDTLGSITFGNPVNCDKKTSST